MKRYEFSQQTVTFPDMINGGMMRQIIPGPMTENAFGEWVRWSDHKAALELAVASTIEGKLDQLLKLMEEKK